ncbi:hypothetical protein D7X33_27020 [Butyricicoccus sp. 1XD8-22]|nr:hypothetical protein D7X33_27020 [Butyricicoccus sp. 1XD8-22]
MKPTLNILGHKHNIKVVVVEDETGVDRYVYDKDKYSFMDPNETADFAQTIENHQQLKTFINQLEDTLKESRDYLKELKVQIADAFLRDIDLPFPCIELKPIVEEIKGQVTFIEGLELALDIANGKFKVSEVPSTE